MSDDKTTLQQQASEDLPASIAPIEAIMEEAGKFEKMPDQYGILQGRPLNEVIDESLTKHRPKTHCRGLIVEGENTVVFASSNVGKSVACYQMAEQICKDTGKVVNYLDFELSDMHLLDRYTDAETKARHFFPQTRYIKQVKVRTGAELYGADNVLVYRLIQTDGFTHFEFQEYGRESDHLKENNSFTEMEDIKEISEMVAKKMSVREIARETGMTASTVHRRIKKGKKLGIISTQEDSHE